MEKGISRDYNIKAGLIAKLKEELQKVIEMLNDNEKTKESLVKNISKMHEKGK